MASLRAEFVSGMAQKSNATAAVTRDAPIKPLRAEFAARRRGETPQPRGARANGAVKGGVCCRHGARQKRCSRMGCTNRSQNGGVCLRHGARATRCGHEGCANYARKGRVCVRHGAEKNRHGCIHEGCANYARKGRVCIRHSAKVKRCIHGGCANKAYCKGGVCNRHRAFVKRERCSQKGCINQAKQGGVCVGHGGKVTRCIHAKVKLCCHEGCTNNAHQGGICLGHGVKSFATSPREVKLSPQPPEGCNPMTGGAVAEGAE